MGEVIGEALLGTRLKFSGRLLSVVLGGILYYLVVDIALWLKIDSNMLKLITAIIVAAFLAVPYLRNLSKSSFSKAAKNSQKEIH